MDKIVGRWYWVTRGAKGDDIWFPAIHSDSAVGGWSNEDCWEDWNGEVINWVLIPLPDEIMKETVV